MKELLSAEGASYPKLLTSPQPGKNVRQKQRCPGYSPRDAVMAAVMKECWYCKYADFHLSEAVALEVGICCYPNVQSR